MSVIYQYAIVNAEGDDVGGPYDDADEAITAAQAQEEPHAVMRLAYVYDDSELAWAPGGGNEWPPVVEHPCPDCGHETEVLVGGVYCPECRWFQRDEN